MFFHVLPLTRAQLAYWKERADAIPDSTLREQALASLANKQFHADGGSVYAARRLANAPSLVRLIVALQTISDYLDNLCDRCGSFDERDFHQLHHAMRDAVKPTAPLRPYYAFRGSVDDGGYLDNLVRACQQELMRFPGYPAAQPYVEKLTERYCELQEYKHIEPSLRMNRLIKWSEPFLTQYPGVWWWEFAAATGSTLGMFALFAASQEPLTESQAKAIYEGYFPWVCGLHILLDYLIDLQEDSEENDFNFIRCYPSMKQAHHRLHYFKRQALQHVQKISKNGSIHLYIVRGLLAMYLSDKKTGQQSSVQPARRMVWNSGITTWIFYGACVLYRRIR